MSVCPFLFMSVCHWKLWHSGWEELWLMLEIWMTDIQSLSPRIPRSRQTNEQAWAILGDVLIGSSRPGLWQIFSRREGEHLFYSTESKMTWPVIHSATIISTYVWYSVCEKRNFSYEATPLVIFCSGSPRWLTCPFTQCRDCKVLGTAKSKIKVLAR